jgi:hypothetical protein
VRGRYREPLVDARHQQRLPTVGGVDDICKTWQIQGPSEIRADMRFIHLSFGLLVPATSPQAHADRRSGSVYKEDHRAIGSEHHMKVCVLLELSGTHVRRRFVKTSEFRRDASVPPGHIQAKFRTGVLRMPRRNRLGLSKDLANKEL